MKTPKDFAKQQGLTKKIEEDYNPYIVYSIMQEYAEHYHAEKTEKSVSNIDLQIMVDEFDDINDDRRQIYLHGLIAMRDKLQVKESEWISVDSETYTKEDMRESYKHGEKGKTYYLKDTTVILPSNYEGIDG